MGIVVIDSLQRGGSGAGEFPVAKEADIKISYLTVADIPARDAIPEWKRLAYMRVHVISNSTDYKLGVDVTIAGQNWTVVNAGISGGTYQLLSEKNQPLGYVGLESNGKINPIYIDNIYSNNSYVVADNTARNALTTVTGDVIVTTGTSKIWVKLNNNPAPAVDGDFAELQFPGSVTSVNGQIGVVTITIANLLAVPQNVTDLDTYISTNNTISTLNSIVSTHSTQISTLESQVAALEGLTTESSLETYNAALGYNLNRSVKFLETSGKYNLYVANAVVSAAEVPGVSVKWDRIGDFYTTAETTAYLALKADLVGGSVPVNQLPAAALAMTHIVATLGERNALTPQVTGMRVYVTANNGKYIYQPGHGLADVNGFVTENADVGSVGGGIEYAPGGGLQLSAFTGDVTKPAGSTVLTIANSAVTYAKMQNVSGPQIFLGRNTGGAGVVEELNAVTATSMLNLFSASLKGLAPASGGGTANFLRADGSWAAPTGSGHEIFNAADVAGLTPRTALRFRNGLTAADVAAETVTELGGALTKNTLLNGNFNLQVNTKNFGLFSDTPDFEEGDRIMFVGVCTTPPVTPPTSGVFLFVLEVNGNYELRVMDSFGNIKSLS